MNKSKVARSFSRSATTYDGAAHFQREVGQQLLSLLPAPASPLEKGICMDLGCGTGHFSQALGQRFPHYQYIGVDLAEGMLHFAQGQQPNIDQWVCADAEALPFGRHSIDRIFSNMALQWCQHLPLLFKELYRILSPCGIMAFSTLGPDTLRELKLAWAQVDNLVHVNTFAPQAQWRSAILDSGLSIVSEQQQRQVLRYHRVQDLLKELKQLGAHNINDGQRQTLTGRQRLKQFFNAYQDFKTQGYYPATYDSYFYLVKKSA